MRRIQHDFWWVDPEESPDKITDQQHTYVAGKAFLRSQEWATTRYTALKEANGRCVCCGARGSEGVRLNVDHIKPRKTHPHLALCQENLQVLCADCNRGKGNWDETDWRKSGSL